MKNLLIIVFLTASFAANAQQFRYGFYVSPVKNTWVLNAEDYEAFGPTSGFQYGILLDQTIGNKQRFAITTGITLDYTQGGMQTINVSQGASEKNWMVRAQYLELPLALKVRTNQLGSFTFYLQGGGTIAKCLRARGDYTENGLTLDSDINYLENELTTNMYLPINMSVDIGIGTEFAINETASILLGLYFKNGLTDIYEDNNTKSDILLQQFGVQIGGLF